LAVVPEARSKSSTSLFYFRSTPDFESGLVCEPAQADADVRNSMTATDARLAAAPRSNGSFQEIASDLERPQ